MHQISVVVWNILDTNINQVTTFVPILDEVDAKGYIDVDLEQRFKCF